MKGQQKKLKQQIKKYKSNCKKAKAEKKALKEQIIQLEKQLNTLKKSYSKAKASKKKHCKAYKIGKTKLAALKIETLSTPKKKVNTEVKTPLPKPSPSKRKVSTAQPKVTSTTRKKQSTPRRKTVTKPKISTKPDNLKLIEGIGPKIEQLLREAGIKTFQALSTAPIKKLREILTVAGPRFRMHDPGTWARQAKLAASGNLVRLKTLQKQLKGGRKK